MFVVKLNAHARQHLRHVTFTNGDGTAGVFWIHKNTDDNAYQVLTRAAKSIAGLGYEWIKGFEIGDPETWDGKILKFKLMPNNILPQEKLDELLMQKFAHWNWQLTNIGDNTYIAKHAGGSCSATREQLKTYFTRQCGETDAAK